MFMEPKALAYFRLFTLACLTLWPTLFFSLSLRVLLPLFFQLNKSNSFALVSRGRDVAARLMQWNAHSKIPRGKDKIRRKKNEINSTKPQRPSTREWKISFILIPTYLIMFSLLTLYKTVCCTVLFSYIIFMVNVLGLAADMTYFL